MNGSARLFFLWIAIAALSCVPDPAFEGDDPGECSDDADNDQDGDPYWHPAVQAFKDLYGRGDLALIQNVGYPKPNLSHFRSYKKWHSADPAATTVSTGWLANWLKKGYTGGFSIPALNIDRRLNPAFATARVPVLRSLSTYEINSDTKSPSGQDKALELQLMESNAAVLRPTATPTLQFLTNSD